MSRKSGFALPEDAAERVAFLEKHDPSLSLPGPSSPPASVRSLSVPASPRFAPPSPNLGAGPLAQEVGKAPRTWRRAMFMGLVGAAMLGMTTVASRGPRRTWILVLPGMDMDAGGSPVDMEMSEPLPSIPLPGPEVPTQSYAAPASSAPSETTSEDPSPSPTPSLPVADRIVLRTRPSPTFEPLPSFTPPPSIPYEDVRPHPRLPPQLLDPDVRYLAFAHHSGFHNQRKAVENAFLLAKMLNRTLLLPAARLGRPIPWAWTGRHQWLWDHEIKAEDRHCLEYRGIGPDGARTDEPPPRCEMYGDWTAVQWDYLFDFAPLASAHPAIDRWDYREEWLWEALQLQDGDYAQMQDPDRYTYQFWEETPSPNAPPPSAKGKWLEAITVEDLRKWDSVKLLEVGSLYGSSRLQIRSAELKALKNVIRKAQICRHELIAEVSDAIAARLGGRGQYIGMHLRVGDLMFKRLAPQNMPRVFRQVCSALFMLDDSVIESLITQSASIPARKSSKGKAKPPHQRRSPNRILGEVAEGSGSLWGDEDDFDEDAADGQVPLSRHRRSIRQRATETPSNLTNPSNRLAASVRCRGNLHTDPALQVLNTPVYIATDSRDPLHDRNLKLFFDTFPCAFVLGDFTHNSEMTSTPVEALKKLDELRSEEDGLGLGKFLYPMLEAVIVAKASGLVGTPTSTFSEYAVAFLHPAYAAEDAAGEVI